MIVTFVAHSIPHPAGGLMALYEYANGLARRGYGVQIVHKWHPFRDDKVRRVEDIGWFRFEEAVEHHFTDSIDALPDADFIFWSPSVSSLRSAGGPMLPARCGWPLMFVQGDLTGTDKLRVRIRAPFPKICCARWLVEVGRRAGVPDAQLVHVPYGIRHDVFRVLAPIEDRPAQVAMLYSAHPKKGSDDGLAALVEVKSRVPELRAAIFGTREPDQRLPPWVTFFLSPPRDTLVGDVYNGSRIFLQPSLQEGFGFTPVEAMACGCAVVSTANGGSDDYAFDDDTAVVTDPGDVDAMARGIERLLRDDGTRVRLARRGNAFVQRFDWDTSASLLEAFLQDYGSDPARYQQPAAPGD